MKHVYFSLTYRSISYIFAPASCYNSSHYTWACITTKSVAVLIILDLNEQWKNFRLHGLASKTFISSKLYLELLSELTCSGRGSEVVGNAVRNEWVFPLDDDFCSVCLTWCNQSSEQETMRTDRLLKTSSYCHTIQSHRKKPFERIESPEEAGLCLSRLNTCLKYSLHELPWPLGALGWSAEPRDWDKWWLCFWRCALPYWLQWMTARSWAAGLSLSC